MKEIERQTDKNTEGPRGREKRLRDRKIERQ